METESRNLRPLHSGHKLPLNFPLRKLFAVLGENITAHRYNLTLCFQQFDYSLVQRDSIFPLAHTAFFPDGGCFPEEVNIRPFEVDDAALPYTSIQGKNN